jgi:hypothetical protein
MSHEKSEKIILMFVYLELNFQGNKITLAAKLHTLTFFCMN